MVNRNSKKKGERERTKGARKGVYNVQERSRRADLSGSASHGFGPMRASIHTLGGRGDESVPKRLKRSDRGWGVSIANG